MSVAVRTRTLRRFRKWQAVNLHSWVRRNSYLSKRVMTSIRKTSERPATISGSVIRFPRTTVRRALRTLEKVANLRE